MFVVIILKCHQVQSDEAELVYKILSLAGIVMVKPGLGTYAEQQITAQKTQEKQ